MCDLYSWGVVTHDLPEKHLKAGDLIFLTDAEAESLILRSVESTCGAMDWGDCVGHSALANYYGISERAFNHEESLSGLPDKLYQEIQRGHLDQLIAASDKPFAKNLTYVPGGVPGTWDIDPNNPCVTLSTHEHLAAFEFCNRWLRKNAPKKRTYIMRLLEARRLHREDFPGCVAIAPQDIVNELLHWSEYPGHMDTLKELHEALRDEF